MRLLANPIQHPSQLLNEAFSNFISLKDKALVLKLILNIRSEEFEIEKKTSTYSFLKTFGFSDNFIELFWRPFCAGVFLDKELEVNADFFIFLIRNFSVGKVGVPKKGMQEIPLQMSRHLDSAKLKLGVRVKELSEKQVLLTNGEVIQAKAVVCAFNQDEQNDSENFRSVINYYFSTKEPLTWGKWLLIVPPQYGFHINNISVMSEVSTSYSSDERNLISVSVIGKNDPGESVVADELKRIAGFDLNLQFVEKFEINRALPRNYSTEQTGLKNGIYFCGDHLGGPSIDGALKSGRLTAEKILADF